MGPTQTHYPRCIASVRLELEKIKNLQHFSGPLRGIKCPQYFVTACSTKLLTLRISTAQIREVEAMDKSKNM